MIINIYYNNDLREVSMIKHPVSKNIILKMESKLIQITNFTDGVFTARIVHKVGTKMCPDGVNCVDHFCIYKHQKEYHKCTKCFGKLPKLLNHNVYVNSTFASVHTKNIIFICDMFDLIVKSCNAKLNFYIHIAYLQASANMLDAKIMPYKNIKIYNELIVKLNILRNAIDTYKKTQSLDNIKKLS